MQNNLDKRNTMTQLIELNVPAAMKSFSVLRVPFLQTENFTIHNTELNAFVEEPWHKHPYKVVNIVMEGEFEMEIGDEAAIYGPGMIGYIPANKMHRVFALSDCKIITIRYHQQQMNYK